MKASDIMMYLLIFNLVLWLLGGYGLNLYNLNVPAKQIGINTNALNQSVPYTTSNDNPTRADAFLNDVGGTVLTLFIITIAGASVMGYIFNKLTTPQGIVYGAFTAIFWTSYGKTVQVFSSIFAGFDVDVGAKVTIFSAVFLIFTGICAFVFAFGLMQMVTGGWRFMK